MIQIDIKVVLISVAVLTLIFLVYAIIKTKVMKTKIEEELKKYFKDETVEKTKGLSDYKVKMGDKTLLIKYVSIPSNSSVSINYLYTWQMYWGGSSAKAGRAYSKSAFLTEMEEFLKMDCKEDEVKVTILYPSTEHVDVYLNEHEMERVDVWCKKYGYAVTSFKTLANDLDKLRQILTNNQ